MSKAKVTTVGDRVKLTKDNLVGVVRFVGEIQGKKGVFFGVELDNAKGKNNGSFNKVPYFKCKKNKGKFVKQAGIAKTNPKNNADALRITVGDKVKCKKQKCNAWHSEIHWHFLFSLYPIYFGSRSMERKINGR
eukprot:764013_1